MITYATGTTDRTPGAWYLDHEVIDGVLTVRCDAAKLDDAHLTTRITAAIWTVDGVKYHTVRVGHEGGIVEIRATRWQLALDAALDAALKAVDRVAEMYAGRRGR